MSKVNEEILHTTINHSRKPHCCGCLNIRFDSDQHVITAKCNGCGVEMVLYDPLQENKRINEQSQS